MLRAAAALLICLVVLATAGCGAGPSRNSDTDLADLLAYLPADAPVAITLDLNLEDQQYRNVDRILARFPVGEALKNKIKQTIAGRGFDYDKDVKPLLGGELVLALPDRAALEPDGHPIRFVGALHARDPGKVRARLDADRTMFKGGEQNGATVYQSTGGAVAIDGRTLVVASTRPDLDAALSRHDRPDHLDKRRFDSAFAGLPAHPLARVFTDNRAILAARPGGAAALRKIPAAAAMGPQGATLSVEGSGISFDAYLPHGNVDPRDLPLAAGDAPPPVARPEGQVGVALRGVMQTIGFAERLAQATAPARYALYEKRKRAAGRRFGIDVDRDLIGQFTGDTFASFGVDGRWALRNEVRDPAALRALLVRIADAGALGTWKVARLNGGGDLYAVLGDGGVPFTMGMIGRSFVLARDPAAAGELAAAQPAPVPGAKGALALSADGEAIAGQLLQRFAAVGGMASYLTAPIGDLRGWSSATRSHVELKIH